MPRPRVEKPPKKQCTYRPRFGPQCPTMVSHEAASYDTDEPRCSPHRKNIRPTKDMNISIAHQDKSYKTKLRWDE